jgi:TnsA endonuclease N terminal.
MTRRGLTVKRVIKLCVVKGTAMFNIHRLHRRPSFPHAAWLSPANRLTHIQNLVRRREPDAPLRSRVLHVELEPPRRKLPTNNQHAEAGIYSRKTETFQFAEAKGERHLLTICEADPAVISYTSQPHTLRFRGDCSFEAYTPDVLINKVDNVTEVVEVKYDYRDAVDDTRYLRKLLAASRYYDSIGWRFSILTEADDLEGSISLANARAIDLCKNDQLDTADLFRLSVLLGESGGSSTLGAAEACLKRSEEEHPAFARRKVLAAISGRELGVDIHGRLLNPSSVVWSLGSKGTSR